MTSTLNTLIEKAIQTDSDAEAMACLRQAKKIYRGQPVTLPKRVVRPQTTEIAETNAVVQRAVDTVRTAMQAEIDKLMKETHRLGAENTDLGTKQIKLHEQIHILENNHNRAAHAAKRALAFGIVWWAIAIVAMGALVAVLI